MQNLNINVQELSYISLFGMSVPDQLEPLRRPRQALQGWSSMRYNINVLADYFLTDNWLFEATHDTYLHVCCKSQDNT